METSKMSIFQKFVASFSQFKAYTVFAKESSGKAVAYLLLLTFTIGTIGLIKPVLNFNKGVDEALDSFKTEVRDFTFENGRLEVEGDMPIIIGEDTSPVIIIDTTGGTTEEVLDQYNEAILLTDTQLIQKQNEFQIRYIVLTRFGS